MEYLGYIAQLVYDDDKELLQGSVPEIGITFEAKTLEEAERAFQKSVTDYLIEHEKEGQDNEEDSPSDSDWNDLEMFKSMRGGNIIPFVTISKPCCFNISKRMLQSFPEKFEGINYCSFFYSKRKNAICIKFHKNRKEGSYKMLKHQEAYRLPLNAFVYFSKKKIQDICGKYYPEWEDIPEVGECLVIYLKDGE